MKRISLQYREPISADTKGIRAETSVQNTSDSQIVSGWKKSWIHLQLKYTLLKVLVRCYKNPLDWLRGLRYLVKLRRRFLGDHNVRKMINVGKLYYMGLNIPGWNDAAYRKFIASELYLFKPHEHPIARFNQLYLAITKKCPLQCEHCYAWDTLNSKDELGVCEYQHLIGEIEKQGVSQVHFSGGEPLVKIKLLETLIAGLSPDTKAWVDTSGFHMTPDKVKRLKHAGLTGVSISLDHYQEEKHNAFRYNPDAYYWALEGAKNALAADLVVAFSVCLSNDMSTEGALMKYMTLAKNTGIHFVQFLEPKAIGHYKNKSVELSKESTQNIEAFFLKMNFGKQHKDFPLISYHGYYQRRVGCLSAGKRAMYITADGHLNACPFCQKSYGNLLEGGLEEKVRKMSNSGCPSFASF